MLKKIGIGLLLAVAALILMFDSGDWLTPVYACDSLSQCRERQREVQENIDQLLLDGEELSEEIVEVQVEISQLRIEISILEGNIFDLQTDLAILGGNMAELSDEIEENLDILEQTEAGIEILLDEVAQRMRVAQRINNQNSLLLVLSEAENLIDLIRRVRFFTQFAEDDAEILADLTALMDFQDNLLLELEEQREKLQATTEEFEEKLAALEVEQDGLEIAEWALIDREAIMQDQLYRLNEDLQDEEALLASLEEAEEILRRSPPPPVTTQTGGSGNSNHSTPQTPNASGLAHPMPGAHVTDEFGSRGGSHRGIDLVVRGNTSAPILAAADGRVITNEWHPSFGNYLIISHNIDGQRVDTLYAHLRYLSPVAIGAEVAQGDNVGTKGNTGNSFGAHLHFEVHPGGINWVPNRGVNPRLWINF